MTQTVSPNIQAQKTDCPQFENVKMACVQHPSSHYVLYCISQNCNTPICVDCEEPHSYQHEHENTSENYISFSEHIRKQSQFLRNLLQKSKEMKSHIVADLKDQREQYLKVVNFHFDRLEKEANQIQIQPSYIKEIEDNYKRIQEGKSCEIIEHIYDENIPELVDNIEEFAEYLQNSVYIKPGIQIVSNQPPEEGRKRHHSEKIDYPKAYWVDDVAEAEVKSEADRNEIIRVKPIQKLVFMLKNKDPKGKGKPKKVFMGTSAVNKGFEIRDEKPEENLCFKSDKEPKKPISPKKTKAANVNVKGLIQFKNYQENPELAPNN